MSSQRDKDFHKLRNPSQYGLSRKHSTRRIVDSVPNENGMHTMVWESVPFNKEDGEAQKAFDKLHNKYGGKSMVFDKRRRCSTRKGNQKVKKITRRIERAQGKEEVVQIVKCVN